MDVQAMLKSELGCALRAALDLVFPERCAACAAELPVGHFAFCAPCRTLVERPGLGACRRCGLPVHPAWPGLRNTPGLCGRCSRHPPPFHSMRHGFTYGGPLARAITRWKYGGAEASGRVLARLLAESPSASALRTRGAVVVPVPSHPRRVRERGFDPAGRLAIELSRRWRLEAGPRVLRRVVDTPQQAGLARRERLANLRAALRVRQPARIRGRPVLLVDDVYTTGATVDACCRLLKRAGAARANVVTLARTAD